MLNFDKLDGDMNKYHVSSFLYAYVDGKLVVYDAKYAATHSLVAKRNAGKHRPHSE